MIDFFDRLYSRIENRTPFLVKIRYYSFLRFAIRTISNLVLPIYFRSSQNKEGYSLTPCTKNEGRLIVSFTSFPKRIRKIWMVVESILRQDMKPDKLILWLSRDQFPTLDVLPNSLLQLQNRGLEIMLCEGDIRSHKKYFYAMKQFPNDTIITIDDDILYNSHLIENLVSCCSENPESVIANHVRKISFYNGQYLPYETWKTVKKNSKDSILVQIGIGGVLYPPHILHADVTRIDKAQCYTPLADDIWLFVMARINHRKIVKSNYTGRFLPIQYLSNVTLSSTNKDKELNDKQIEAVRKHYMDTIGVDPFGMN